jgi:hypothetical protein
VLLRWADVVLVVGFLAMLGFNHPERAGVDGDSER